MIPEKKTKKGAWLGLNLVNSPNCVKVRTHLTGSPCREMIHTADEIVAIDGLRVKSSAEINAAIHGSINTETKITISRQGVLKEVTVTPIENPMHKVKIEGKGNKLWNQIKSTRR